MATTSLGLRYPDQLAPVDVATYFAQLAADTDAEILATDVTGSNSNGIYVKLRNGTLICTMRITVTDQAIANAYVSGALTLYWGSRGWTFPVAFVSAPVVTCGQFLYGTAASWPSSPTAVSATGATLVGMDVASRATGTTTVISATATGRWK